MAQRMISGEETRAMELRFGYEGTAVAVSAEQAEGGWRVRLSSDAAYDIALVGRNDETVELRVELSETGAGQKLERILQVPYVRFNETIVFAWKGQTYRFAKNVPLAEQPPGVNSGKCASGNVSSPTGGVVADVFVTAGQMVEAYQQIAIVEAMKVMTVVEAPYSGRIETLFIVRGERIERGAAIAVIVAPDVEPSGPGVVG
jgi:biotin carboxyl carrier protein